MNTDQINIEFNPSEAANSFSEYINAKTAYLTNGISLNAWIESIGNQLYNQYKQIESEIDILEVKKYLPLRKVSICRHNRNLAVHARLIVNNSDFIIELKDYGKKNDLHAQNFFIAHELAHTFFFDLDVSPIRDMAIFPPGSKEIEYLCNRLARSILMPTAVLYDQIQNSALPGQPGFSLNAINKFCTLYSVPASVVLNRLITDTNYWDCLFFRFLNFENEANNWKLKERYLPKHCWNNKDTYVPMEDFNKSKDNPNRYPSAKNKLKQLFDVIYPELKQAKRLTIFHSKEEISEGILKKIISFYFKDEQKVTAHYSIGTNKFNKTEYLNLCIPLPKSR